ncbi:MULTISPECIES: hypothetical protein [unclassified Sinorhizobium]|uniref:hypothetical protein n=1 Tax=unclassified Sinorhizobium TaxID=2613772 RepID=UPI0024C30ADB|nr:MULTISPECIES: hypothetical protein [unclassified Sinorhizobium]MDK1373215.1 hypothetical protein [Sinorhizobium sp. 6-70]MDK1480828.1 hypothetical protein [Sinorhizobium sp. 6-117]
MTRELHRHCIRISALAIFVQATLWFLPASAADPYASNNGLYPQESEWSGPYRSLNYNYPETTDNKWFTVAPRAPLNIQNASDYVAKLKAHLEPNMRAMIDAPDTWDPAANGWYGMIWQGAGTTGPNGVTDPESGQEAILGSFSGQIITKETFQDFGLTVNLQNHTVIYYDALSATMLRKLWDDPFKPNRKAVSFPEGGMVVKAAAVTPTPQQWPVVEDSAIWNVYRPTVESLQGPDYNPYTNAKAVVVPLRVLQFDIIVKDTIASPQTGWVFVTYVYDKDAPGATTWDKLVPLGAMWGNDPAFAREPNGTDPKGGPLQETWINQKAPAYAISSLGWGGRLSGPIDVSERHNVLLTNGNLVPVQPASSCLSCHGTAQFPFVANLYPSPNKAFPREGTLFPMYPPGSEMWARWFQNRPGSKPQNDNENAVALDYDMLIMFALSAYDAAAGNDLFVQEHVDVH